MSDERLYQTMSGKAGGPFEGRTFVRVPGYMTTSRQMLADAGCDRKGPGSYLLPTGREDDLVARLDEMTVTDRDQAMKDRLPVSPEAAGGIAIGDIYDFGGEVGEAPVVGIGATFTPRGESQHDPRLETGAETVYLYNANAPKSAMQREAVEAPERDDEPAA